jgi:hypothetical protein
MNKNIFIILLIGFFCLFSLGYVMASPNGAGITPGSSTSANADNPDSQDAYAGNVTELTISGFSTTQSWHGFYGNVSGVIQLADSASHVMYNWSQLNPRGEIYASTNGTVAWNYIQCFNYTADGTYASDTARAGSTSLHGMNITQLHANYNITTDDSDAVNNTFALSNHALFYTNNLEFAFGECKNMKVYDSAGAGSFDEALLYEPTGRSVVFTSILKSSADGFDGNTHDFEMLVLENGHNGDVSVTPYFFYMEIA